MFSNCKIYVWALLPLFQLWAWLYQPTEFFSTLSLSALLHRLIGCFILWFVLHIARQNIFSSLQRLIYVYYGAIRDILSYASFIYHLNHICITTAEAFFVMQVLRLHFKGVVFLSVVDFFFSHTSFVLQLRIVKAYIKKKISGFIKKYN